MYEYFVFPESLLKKACLLSDDNDDVWNRKPFIL